MTLTVDLLAWPSAQAEARPLRLAVFVEEQNVPLELEWDEWDERSVHAIARVDGAAVGTGRLLPASETGTVKIGRMAVGRSYRGRGVGAAILAALIERARHEGASMALLHAQADAAGFYRRAGFIPRGEIFFEAGIPHVEMTRSLQGDVRGQGGASP